MDVKTICLGVLSLGDATGYEIRKMFEDGPFGHFFDASYGSIYPALGKLLGDGLVALSEEEHSGRPDKKVYSLTPEGRVRLKEALAEPAGRDRLRSEYLVRLFFAHLMEPRDSQRIYDEYLANFEHMAACACETDPTDMRPGRRIVRGFGLHLYEAMAAYMRDHRDEFVREMNEADPVTDPVTEAAQ
ncbi:MAG: PadR family transcriptional regulator [Rhodospirillaceae bacterium]|nr:PadR family transcriptional regulator [Rhodospirillaceae bacterium]